MHGQAQSPAQSQTSRSTIQVPRRKVSDIFQEQAPFAPQSVSSSHSQLDYAPERMSSESEEHPFEHWYRGDVARNGGVGELRVARRQEMLDIANYGHTLRKASGKSHSGLSSRSRSNSRGRDMPNGRPGTRQRSDSVGARESIYIDDEGVAEGNTVMDERPLTDLDDDGYDDQIDDYYAQAVQPHPNGSISSPSLDIRSDTPTSRHTQNTSRSRIPQPASRSRTTTPTPAKPTRSASESGLASPSSPAASPSVPRSATQPLKTQGLSPTSASPSTPSTPTAKRRAKSPANSTPQSSAKKQKAKAPPSSMQKRPGPRNEENRRSIGQYPLPDGDEDAIPTWTQPRPANGNWDDVSTIVSVPISSVSHAIGYLGCAPCRREKERPARPVRDCRWHTETQGARAYGHRAGKPNPLVRFRAASRVLCKRHPGRSATTPRSTVSGGARTRSRSP